MIPSTKFFKTILICSLNMSLIQKLLFEKGKPLLGHAGLVYTVEKTTTTKIIFRCQNRDCKRYVEIEPVWFVAQTSLYLIKRVVTQTCRWIFFSLNQRHTLTPRIPNESQPSNSTTKSKVVLQCPTNHRARFCTLLYELSHSVRLDRFHDVIFSCKLFGDNEQQQWWVRTVSSLSILKQPTEEKPSCSIKMPKWLSSRRKTIYLFSSIPNIGLLMERFEWVTDQRVFVSNYLWYRFVRTISINYSNCTLWWQRQLFLSSMVC